MSGWAMRMCAFLGVLASGLLGCGAAETFPDGAAEDVASETSLLPISIASALDGVMLTAPCLVSSSLSTCQTKLGGCPASNPDTALSGALLTDKTVTLGGSPGQTYTVTLRIQGVVEAKRYVGATDSNGTAISPRANGFATGGVPTPADAYGVYLLRTSNPPQDYFLNSLVPPGVSDRSTYGVDYTAQIRARGGSTIRLVASDRNCSQAKNCGPIPGEGVDICRAPITLVPSARAVAANPSFNFNVPHNGQWLVMTVARVD